MPSWLLMCGASAGAAVLGGLTRYVGPTGFLGPTSVEAGRQTPARDTYTLSNLYVRVTANALSADTTVRSRKNTADGNQLVTIGAGATGAFEDAINSDSLVTAVFPNDIFNTRIITGADGADSITFTLISYILKTTSANVPILAASGSSSSVGFGATRYYPLMGDSLNSATEVTTAYLLRTAATLSRLACYVSSNGIDGATTFRTRITGVNGAQSFSIGAGATGLFEDTLNTDAVAVGQFINCQAVAVGTVGSLTITMQYVKSTSLGRQVAFGRTTGNVLSWGQTVYASIEGTAQQAAAEADVQATARVAFLGRNLFVSVPTNTINGASTFRMRKNTGNGNLNLSIGAGGTGFFQDLTNLDSFVAADVLNYGIITLGNAGSMTINFVGFELDQVGGMMGILPQMMKVVGAT